MARLMPALRRTLLLAAAVAAQAAQAAPAPTPVDVVEAFHGALATGDRVAALGFLHPQVLVYEAGGVEHGREAYAAGHLDADMEFARNAQRRVVSQRQQLFGEWALVTGTFETEWAGARLQGTETMVLERGAQGWRIIHVHWSSRRRAEGGR